MRAALREALQRSRLEDDATRFAREAIGDSHTDVDRQEALVETESFVRIYSIRAENLAQLGKPTWNFHDLLKAVSEAGLQRVRVSLLRSPTKRVVVVRDEEGELIGCAAFGP